MNIQLKGRQLEILKYLVAAGTPLEASYFTEKFKKSERTIHYDINVLRQFLQPFGVDIKIKMKKGFYIPVAHKPKCTMIISEHTKEEGYLLDGDEAKQNIYLFFYFFAKGRTITADEVAEAFYVSRSTALRMIVSFNTEYPKTPIKAQKNSGFQISGDDFILRTIAMRELADLFKGSYTIEDWFMLLPAMLKKATSFQLLTNITEAIKKANTKHNVWISNLSFTNLLCYCLARDINLQNINSDKLEMIEPVYNGTYVNDLLYELNYSSINHHQESEWLFTILNINGIHVDDYSDTEIHLDKIVDEMLDILTKQRNIYSYEFDTITLYEDLYGHFQNFVKNEYNYIELEDNPLIEEIKSNYHDFYSLAVLCAKAFLDQNNVELSENEISYIAIYLYKNLINQTVSNKRVIVVCATGKGLSNLLTTRIHNVFPNLIVVNQASPYQIGNLYKWKNIDFVISTIPLNDCAYPVVKISRILSMEDIQRIQEFIHYGKYIDSIPFANPNIASLHTKVDPFDLNKINFDIKNDSVATTSIIFSKLILTLLEYTSKFSKEYEMNQDALLGLIIHMSMAVPRWFMLSEPDDFDDLSDKYYVLKQKHQSVFVIMEKFFSLVEDSLLVSIPVHERYAFFIYIIHEEEE